MRHLISFFKWRAWRYSPDLRTHIIAELLEDLVRNGKPLPQEAEDEITRFLAAQNRDGTTPFAPDVVAAALGVDLASELEVRARHDCTQLTETRSPATVVCIVGAPRAGTTTLLDRLAYHTNWAIITDHSHHLWPRWGLNRARTRLFRGQRRTVLDRDTRDIRLDPSISWPSEAENILHRHVPSYQHLGGHRYRLYPEPTDCNQTDLKQIVTAHLDWFDSDTLLLKSPFNVTRIPALREAIGGCWHIIHKTRALDDVAASIERVGFEYTVGTTPLTPHQAATWFHHHAAIAADTTISQDDLMADPERQIDRLIDDVAASGTALRVDDHA